MNNHAASVSRIVGPYAFARAWARTIPAALALLSGALYWLAFPNANIWPLAFVCWVPLLVAIRGRTTTHAFALGTLQGMSCLGAMYWLVPTIRSFTGFGPLASIVCALVFSAWHALRVGLIAAFYTRLCRNGYPRLIAFPLCLAAGEFVYPVVFPWYGGAQVTQLPEFMQIAELGGVITVSAVLAFVNVALAEGVHERAAGRRARLGLLAISVVSCTYVAGYLRIRSLDRAIEHAAPARIGVIQTVIKGKSRRAALREAALASSKLAQQVELVVWPETVAEEVIDSGALGSWWKRTMIGAGQSEARSVPLLAGMLVRHRNGVASESASNAAVLFEHGKVAGQYNKVRPLAFGEYLPLGDFFPSLYAALPNAGRLERGKQFVTFSVAGHRIAPLICYEDMFGDLARNAVLAGNAELLVNITNDAWFGRSSAWALHLAHAKYRAVEHRKFLVRAANLAGTAVIDAAGRTVASAAPYRSASLNVDVRWLQQKTLYDHIGDWPWLTATVLVVVMAGVRRPRMGHNFSLQHAA